MRFLDFFSGIGGFRLGMEMAGHTCVGHCEVDKFADRSYRAMHNVKESEWYANDITRVEPEELPDADCYCFGFPCQAFSIAGKRRGFEDTRGTLFFEVMRLARERKPRLLFAENVRGLLSHEGGQTFGVIVSTMDELGYDVEWQVLNSKHFGVPQNRERVFIVGHLRETSGRKVFPIGCEDGVPDKKRLETEPSIPTLTATDYKGVSKRRGGIVIPVMFATDGMLIRRLTPRECFRLQGFPDEYFDRAAAVNSDSQLYTQAGNSVTVNVIYEIAKRLEV